MIGCLILAFQLCNPNGYYQQGYYQQGYAQTQAVVYAQPQVVYAQPVYVVQQPVVYAQPYPFYGGGRGGGIGVAVGPRGGVRVRCC